MPALLFLGGEAALQAPEDTTLHETNRDAGIVIN